MIKIIAGALKGKTIKAPTGDSTRPTSSKVRESIFSIIGSYIDNSVWLDLFAGSGSVGFEAISRGAKEVTFIEKDAYAYKALIKNVDLIGISEKAKTIRTDSTLFFKKCISSYDFIFIDPPYMSDLYQKVFESLNKKPAILNEDGFLIVEHASKLDLPSLEFFEKQKSYKYGDTTITIFKKFKDK